MIQPRTGTEAWSIQAAIFQAFELGNEKCAYGFSESDSQGLGTEQIRCTLHCQREPTKREKLRSAKGQLLQSETKKGVLKFEDIPAQIDFHACA
jgi:hypothetical protein